VNPSESLTVPPFWERIVLSIHLITIMDVENVKGMFGVSGRLLTVSKLNKLDTNKTVSFTSRLF
jgi:hypothetical protein